MKKSVLNWIHAVSLGAGALLFVYLVLQTGIGNILRYLAMMGWGFGLVIALSALRNVTRAVSWYLAIDPQHRQVSFWTLMNVMLAGESIKYLTFTGPLLGEPAKAAMVRRDVPLLQGFSSVVVENLIYNLTVFLVMLGGLPALFWLVQASSHLRMAAYLFAGLLVLAILVVWLAIRGRWFAVARTIESTGRLLTRLSPEAADSPPRLVRTVAHLREIEANIYDFYDHRRGAFFAIFSINMLAHFINVVEVCLILVLMQVPAGIAAGFVIEAATKGINGAFFFVPTRAGVYESGHAMVLNALGFPAGAGVALAIIRKLRALVWAAYGLGAIAVISVKDRRTRRPPAVEERVGTTHGNG